MKYIIITGTGGFIGRQLLDHIITAGKYNRSQIVLLGSSPVPGFVFLHHNNYTFTKVDFLSAGITEISAIIHLGAFIPKIAAESNAFTQNTENVINTAHLLNNLPATPAKFIFISTVDVYQPTTGLIDESIPAEPQSFYGTCKLFCEKMVLQWCTQQQVTPQILRLGHIYGPGEEGFKKLIPETIRKILLHQNPVIYSNGLEKRSYLHVSDCVAAIMNAIELDEYHGPVNIASSGALTIRDLIAKIVEVSGRDLPAEILNQAFPVRDLLFDNSKMKKYLGPEKIDIAEGLREEFESMAANYNNKI